VTALTTTNEIFQVEADNEVGIAIEEWTSAKDGTELFSKTWKVKSPVATVVFIHGFGEHINRYNHVFPKFQRANIEVFSYDQRGFGHTGVKNKNLGVTGGWKVATDDITYVLRTRRREGIPQFLFGHSMGGALSLNYAAEGPERENLAGFVISSPLVSQSPETKPPQPVLLLGTAASKVLPSFQIPVQLPSKYVSRIPEEVDKHANDPLNHSIGSLRSLSDMVSGGKALLKTKCRNITKPIYLYHGTVDGLTAFEASKELFDKIPSEDKTFRAWEGGYHELHNDLDQEAVITESIDWILAHVPKNEK